MPEIIHLSVEKGVDAGKKITVPAEGARLGRSTKNDIVLCDPMLSRHHCRLFFKTGDGLWITDLGSANETLVNGKVVQEVRLHRGDSITIGDTVIKVLDDGTIPGPGTVKMPVINVAGAPGSPVVDLGLSTIKQEKGSPQMDKIKLLVILAGVMIIVALAVWLPKILGRPGEPTSRIKIIQPVKADYSLNLDYEKVEASAQNIFWYLLKISTNSIIIQMKDIEHGRLLRKEKSLDPELARDLAKSLLDSGFFSLDEKYSGLQPGQLNQMDLSITVGRKAHSSRVTNCAEPEQFRKVREIVEQFAQNELMLPSLEHFSTDKLKEMAKEAHDLGMKLFNEKEIAYGNLSQAMLEFGKAEWYLMTIEPKPDFYRDMLKTMNDCKTELQSRYESASFRAMLAIKMRQWQDAAKELRIILEMIPDRSDPRNQDARKSLIDVERRLNTKR